MTSFEPRELDLTDELSRLDLRADRLAEQIVNADRNTQGALLLTSEFRDVNESGPAVADLISEYGEDATITIRGLNAGAYAEVEDDIAQRTQNGDRPGYARNVFVAKALVDAPFYEGDASDFDAKLGVISEQSPGLVKWLEDRVSELGRGGSGNWKSSSERLLEHLKNQG